MADIFVSYKAEDRRRVKLLVEALEADGHSVWWDEQIGGGARWRQILEAELNQAKSVVVVWSRRSSGPEGAFVQDEAARAQQRGVYVPITIDKVRLPLGFGETQALPLNGWRGDRSDPRYRAVLQAVERLVGEEPAAQRSPLGPKIRRRAVIAGGAAVTVAVAAGGGWELLKHTGPPSATIAILPFTNLSGDPAQAYFSDGLAEDLRDALSRIAGLSVVARTSSEAVRNDDAKTAAAKLGASDILTGSVRRSSAMLRVSVQLIDGKHGLERWSQVYDQTGGDLLQIESAIADKIADSLSIRLGVTDPKRVQLGGTNNPDAHDLLLKAQSIRGRLFDRDRMQEALELADSAIALDPKYGDALALKASLLSGKAGTFSRNAEEFRVGFAIAERVARQAIAAAPRSPSGYAVLAEIREGQLRLRAASALLSKAAALPGGAAKSLGQYAEFLAFTGRSDEALAKATQLTELDPLNPRAFGTKAEVLGYARRFADAAKTCETAIELSGGIAPARGYHAFCVAMTGDLAAARKELSTVWPDLSQAPTGYVAPLAREDHGLGEQIIAETRKTAGDAAATGYAQIYAQMGRIGAALDQLELAWRVRDPALISLLVDPLCDPLRSEPRFKLLIGQLDFPT